MNTHADKSEEKKSQTIVNVFSQKQSDSKSSSQFVDNRPESIAQRKLQEMTNNNAHVSQLKDNRIKANSHYDYQQQPIQRKQNNTVVQFGAGPSNMAAGGRKYAVAYTAQFAPHQMGYLVNQTVSPFASVFGDLWGGKIGQHYKDRSDALAEDITRERIVNFAITETKWWNQQEGMPGNVGSAMSANMRANILICKAEKLNLIPKIVAKE